MLVKGWADTTWWIISIDNVFGTSEFQITFEPESTQQLYGNQIWLIDSLATPVAVVNMTTNTGYTFHGSRPAVSRMYVLSIGHEDTATISVHDQRPVNHGEPQMTLRAYPNPTTSTIMVDTDEEVTILNYLGREVGKKFQCQTDISNLPSGAYLLRSRTGTGRFVKQ
jgi:hypothetical protein